MAIEYVYNKRRCDFGRQPMFCEHGPEMCDSIAPNPLEYKSYILRNPVHQLTQHTPTFFHNTINTIRAEYTTTGANHAEGGWPKDVNVMDPEATQRYRRKIEKDDPYVHCVFVTSPEMEHYVLQNNAIDMYQIYYSELSFMPPLERNSMRTVNVYRDPKEGRPISSICWEPEGGHRFAVTYVNVDYNRIPRTSILAYVWDVENANEPVVTINPPCALLDLQYNPRDHTILAGGLINGQVAIWDGRHGSTPVQLCPPHIAHRDLVRNVLFIASKSGMEFFSGGPDGVCKWWDIRNMSATTEEMIIDVVKYSFDVPSMPKAYGITAMEYESTIPTRYMVGTENGKICSGNRKGKTALERLPACYDTVHLGPVWKVERNPYFLKNFVSVGDWRVQVWSEDCRDSPVLWSPWQRHKVTDATWSPTRCSLLLSTGWNGVVSAWDLLRRQHVPILTMQVCYDPLLKLKYHEQGSLVALGSSKGNVYMAEVSSDMTQSGDKDKGLMLAELPEKMIKHLLGRLYMSKPSRSLQYETELSFSNEGCFLDSLLRILEREGKREKILEARLREIRLKMRQAEEGSPRHSVGEPDPSIGDRDLIEATQEYNQMVKKELAAM